MLLPASLHAVSVKYTSSGTFTPPAGITNITVECWGGGGAGGSAWKTNGATGNAGGGGGGGGAYAKKLSVPVTPGTPYTVTIPAEAVAPTTNFANGVFSPSGANITFTGDGGVSVTANGGQGGMCVVTTGATSISGDGGLGGAISGSYDVEWSGGNGWKHTTAGLAGSGGNGASDLANGPSRSSQNQGGTFFSSTTGSDADHNGGRGDTGKSGSGAGNNSNQAPGGAGGAGRAGTAGTAFAGANGRQGQIIITYFGTTKAKANNANNLNLGTSWVGGSAPGSVDNALWDGTVTSANTTVLGADTAWGSLIVSNAGGLVTINAGNTLTNNGGIDLSSATADLTLNCDYVLGSGAVWNLAAGRTLTLSGAVSGASGNNITLLGDGTNVLSGANTYGGNTVLTAGSTGSTLKLGANNVIPDGAGKGDVTIGFGCTLDLNGNSETINGLAGTTSGSLISLIDNTAAGTTSTLTVGVTQAVSTLIFNGILQNTGAGSTLNFVKTGANQITLQRAHTLTGTVTVNGGTLAVQNPTPLDNISGLSIGGSTFMCIGSATLPAPVTLTGNATFNVGGNASGTLTLNGPIGGAGDILIQSPANSVGDGPLLILGATNTFTGNVTIDSNPSSSVNGMTVRLGVANALPANTVVTLDGQNATAGIHVCDLDLNGNNQTLAGLTNVTRTSVVATNNRLQRVYSAVDATLTINNSANYTFGGTLGNSIAPADALALVKNGAGTFTLSGTNSTYANGTIINGGTLLVNNTNGSGTGSGAVVINSGGTLGGTGIIAGAVTNNAGGTLSPGASIGTLTLSSNVVLSAGSTNTFEVDGTAATNDIIVLGDVVTYGGVLKIVPAGSFTNGQTFTLFSGAGATTLGNFGSIVVNPPVSGTSFTFTNGVLTAVVAPVGPSGPTTLTNSYSGGALNLSWPAGQGWRLQGQTNSGSTGLGTNWVYVTDGSVSSTNITVDSTQPTVFYRLVYP